RGGAGACLLGGAAARLGLLSAPAFGLDLRQRVGAGALLLHALDAAVERDAVVLARPGDQSIDRRQRDGGVLELFVQGRRAPRSLPQDERRVLDGDVAADRPADPQRHLPGGGALNERAQRLGRRRARRHAIVGRGADGELLGQGAEGVRQRRSVVVVALGQAG